MELYSLGYRTFTPKIKKWATHARVRKAVERPLLGRYLFIEVDHPRQSFGAVKAVNGVETLISNLGLPTPFPSHWVEDMMRRYLSGEWDFVTQEPILYRDADGEIQTRNNPQIQIGARIRIIEGEFDNMLATVTNRKSGKLHCKLLDTNIYTQLREHGVRAA
jgi:transcription antitermination factor NusG